jgi:hypothetical protein
MPAGLKLSYNGEDKNFNGILDPGEDLDGNGRVTRYILLLLLTDLVSGLRLAIIKSISTGATMPNRLLTLSLRNWILKGTGFIFPNWVLMYYKPHRDWSS